MRLSARRLHTRNKKIMVVLVNVRYRALKAKLVHIKLFSILVLFSVEVQSQFNNSVTLEKLSSCLR